MEAYKIKRESIEPDIIPTPPNQQNFSPQTRNPQGIPNSSYYQQSTNPSPSTNQHLTRTDQQRTKPNSDSSHPIAHSSSKNPIPINFVQTPSSSNAFNRNLLKHTPETNVSDNVSLLLFSQINIVI